jgi:hypothetical protein
MYKEWVEIHAKPKDICICVDGVPTIGTKREAKGVRPKKNVSGFGSSIALVCFIGQKKDP